MVYYLDSSAWVKRYFKESGRQWVHRLFDQHDMLACSTLGLIEVGSTMARKRSLRGADSVHLASALVLREELDLHAEVHRGGAEGAE